MESTSPEQLALMNKGFKESVGHSLVQGSRSIAAAGQFGGMESMEMGGNSVSFGYLPPENHLTDKEIKSRIKKQEKEERQVKRRMLRMIRLGLIKYDAMNIRQHLINTYALNL